MGGFAAYQDKDRQKPIKFRSKKERELLAFLLNAGNRGATKEQIYNAIWQESEAINIKNLISVNLTHLKNDLKRAGMEESVICRENHYFICREEIDCDNDLYEGMYEEFKLRNSKELAKKLLSLYKGEYLSDFEALWAVEKRIRYHEAYEEIAGYCLSRG